MRPEVIVFALLSAAIPFAGVAAAAPAQPAMATDILQKCLGITPGAEKMARGPATQQFCKQLPGANLFDQAGERFRAGDHAGAAQIVRKSAEAGNAVAQLRLALMYDQGDGVPQSSKTAYEWYGQGEPEALNQMGLAYELGEGLTENWDLAARFFQASARQAWVKGQASLARVYQFGIGVPQDRRQAIAWFQKAAANGDPNGSYWARWLSDSTNNIGFRDEIERGIVMASKLRFSAQLYSGDPSGVTFHNSAQRALWLQGQRQRADKDEADTFRQIRKEAYDACRRAGRDNCMP